MLMQGITRELVRASSASCLYIADQCGAKRSAGSPPRDQSSPRKGPPLRRVDPSTQNAGTTGTGGTSGNAKELRKGVRQSSRSIVARVATRPTTGANAHAPGHRQPEETYAREAARPGSQGTPAVRGTWCREGEAGRHLRTKAGQAGDTPVGPGTPSPVPISQRLERIATQAREYPDMACHHARPPPGCGDAGTRVSEPQPAKRPWRRPGHMAYVQEQPRDNPGDLRRETRQRHVLSATGRSPSDPHRGWNAQAVRAAGPGGQDRGESRGDADGGDLRAGFLRLLLWLSPWP